MDDENLVLQRSDVGFWRRSEMFIFLKMLPGFDLPDFLEGSKMAYDTVTRGMYARDWDGLTPLVSERMLDAMKGAMEQYGDDAKRIDGFEKDDAIEIASAQLSRVRLLNGNDGIMADRRCHVEVKFTTFESWAIWDFRENSYVAPFDGQRRQQEYTWRFEGVVNLPRMTEAEAAELPTFDVNILGESGELPEDEIEEAWIVESIV